MKQTILILLGIIFCQVSDGQVFDEIGENYLVSNKDGAVTSVFLDVTKTIFDKKGEKKEETNSNYIIGINVFQTFLPYPYFIADNEIKTNFHYNNTKEINLEDVTYFNPIEKVNKMNDTEMAQVYILNSIYSQMMYQCRLVSVCF